MKTDLKTLILLLAVLCTSCAGGTSTSEGGTPAEPFTTAYARGFEVERFEEYTVVSVRNPWDSLKLLHRYILVADSLPLPTSHPEGTLLRTPLRRVVGFASVHCGVLAELSLEETLVGACEVRYIGIPTIAEAIRAGKVADLGEAASPNLERILEIEPEVLITSPINGMSYGKMEKLQVPLLETTDYMETSPLGRAEWIRFYGLFFGKEQEADSIFKSTVESYNAIKALTAEVKARPSVLPETRYGSTWYIPGGRSYVANLFYDAGAAYPWSDLDEAGSVPLAYEQVLERGVDAEVWVMRYNSAEELTYEGLRKQYDGYANFSAFKKRNIYTCNTYDRPYYEELPNHPDYILKDLVWIFHPELLPADYQPRYYGKMPE